MIFRILTSPPGYPEDQRFMVVEYETLDFDSSVKHHPGWKFAATLEEARQMIPADAVRLPFEQEHQFLELYSHDEINEP